MWSYIARRIVMALFTLIIITMICFVLTRYSADPLAQFATNPSGSKGYGNINAAAAVNCALAL